MERVAYKINDSLGEERLKELILYVATRCAHDPAFGATKLNKILWKSDFMAFAHHGIPITGVDYMKLPQGPVPRRLMPLQDELVRDKRAVVAELPAQWTFTRKVTVPLAPPRLSLFTPDQIALVDEVIAAFLPLTAKDVSALSHGKAWEAAGYQETIPYETVFLADEITHDDIVRARALSEEYDLEQGCSSR